MSKYKKLIEAVKKGSQQWQDAFNSGDAQGCADLYEDNAELYAGVGLGTHKGKPAILAFWQSVIDQGLTGVIYLDTKMYVEYVKGDDHDNGDNKVNAVVLSSPWKANVAEGVIHNELWILQEDGTAKLKYDAFEVTEWYKK